MSDILKAFNDHFEEFVGDIQKVFPDDPDIKTAQSGLPLIRMSNSKLIMKTFNEYIVKKYRDEINRGDIAFFVEKDYSREVREGNPVLDKIEQLRNPVRNMDKKNQEKVMKYMKNLMKLCDLYN